MMFGYLGLLLKPTFLFDSFYLGAIVFLSAVGRLS